MIENPVIFRCQLSIATVNKFLTAELLKDLCLYNKFDIHLFSKIDRYCIIKSITI